MNSKNINNYIFREDYAVIEIGKNKTITIIDLDDYVKVKEHTWSIQQNEWGFYVHARINNKWIYLHRLIMDAEENEKIDHIDRNRLNNRKINLRRCTNQQNGANSRMRSNNTTGITGVLWSKKDKSYIAHIKVNYERKILGYYKDIEKATNARLKAEKEYFGEFAPQKYLFERYGIQ